MGKGNPGEYGIYHLDSDSPPSRRAGILWILVCLFLELALCKVEEFPRVGLMKAGGKFDYFSQLSDKGPFPKWEKGVGMRILNLISRVCTLND